MPEPLTLFPAIIIVLIVLLLAFWLFAPFNLVIAQLNWVGNIIQRLVAKIRGLFTKKAPPPATNITILPVNPPTSESTTPTENK